ncbi:hypothetical protein CY35_06G025300 [Sphagnum magellanicum]|nr:hypothetical protein CY35_06G025300 [Sphagnum magellanicum]
MNLPPEATYDDVDALKAACRQHATAHLYSVTTKRSDYKMGVLLLHCGNTKAVQLTRRFGMVLTMDCTYKTNRFKMPLLHIVSFACTGATFTSAIAFLSAKTIEDYEWALNTYKGFMGNYLSLAIVTDRELALMRATEIAFPTFMTLFSGVMRAGTEDELQEKLVQIQTEWYKTYFVGAYVDKVPHFESSSSSRVEGAHLVLKQRLQVSTGDMMIVVKHVLQFLADQYQEIDTAISQQKERRNPIHSDMFYDQVGGQRGLFSCSHQDPPLIYNCQRACRAQSPSATRPPLRDCHGISFSDHNLRSACCKPEPTNECGTQAVVACARSTSWYTCNIDSRACRCSCMWTPIRCCYRRACHKALTNIINASGTKHL